ncbi:MAG: recombinase family protein [Acholeplasmataceae bacterium]|nr:recombinase family protein [Acholeplasmataceae bacterium]
MKKLKNVCAYARVSTLKDVAIDSLDNQISNYIDYIISNKDWNFCGIFVDEGKSGTNKTMRLGFNQMMESARNGYIDLIITKSISRFARNTVDAISLIRELRLINVEVYFENDGISSFDNNIDFVLSVFAGLAEEEARGVSENVKWSNKKRFESGHVNMVTDRFLGYDRDLDGNIIINEAEAMIVRKIFDLYIDGMGFSKIANWLEENNYKTITGNTKWNNSSIGVIIKNEKYTGDALLQKTFRPSFKSQNYKSNKGELPMYQVLNSHPQIISKKTFEKADRIRELRGHKFQKTHLKMSNDDYAKPTIYASFLECSKCGKNFQLVHNKNGSLYSKLNFVCASNKFNKQCDAEPISKLVLDETLLNLINGIIKNKYTFINVLTKSLNKNSIYLEKVKQHEINQNKIKEMRASLETLKNSSSEFERRVKSEIKAQLRTLLITDSNIYKELATSLNIVKFIDVRKKILSKHFDPIMDLDEFPFREFFSKGVVYSRENITFKLGFNDNNSKDSEALVIGETPFVIRKTNNKLKYEVTL